MVDVKELRLVRPFSCSVDLCLSLCLAAINSARGDLSFGALGPLRLRSLRSISGLHLPLRLEDASGSSNLSVLAFCGLLSEDVL